MPRPPAKSRPYKELTLQQLRSFSATARLGSLAAAAKALGLTHPTVREQVLALERDIDARLVEPHGRGCRLTAEGRLLAELVAPLVAGVAALKEQFEQARTRAEVRLVVAGPPRVLQEDIAWATHSFLRDHPHVRLAFLELRDDQVAQAVETGAAEFGLTTKRAADPAVPGLAFEPAYELETLLLAPKQHPLARRRQVRPADLRRYPLLTSRYTLSDQPELAAILERSGMFDGPTPAVEPFLAGTVRRYVELGLGIALVYGTLTSERRSALHERSMSRYFGRGQVRFVFRRGSVNELLARSLAAAIVASHTRSTRRSPKKHARPRHGLPAEL